MDSKIVVSNPVAELDGDEMTRVFDIAHILDHLVINQGQTDSPLP
jgi:hypothetical protein